MAVTQDVDAGAFEFFFERIETVGFVTHVDTTISVSAKRFGRLCLYMCLNGIFFKKAYVLMPPACNRFAYIRPIYSPLHQLKNNPGGGDDNVKYVHHPYR